MSLPWPSFLIAAGLWATLPWVLWSVVIPRLIWFLYRRNTRHHEFTPPPVDKGAGSHDLVYFSCTWDLDAGELSIRGEVPAARYWMVGVYDRWARAIPGGHLNGADIESQGGRYAIDVIAGSSSSPNKLCCGPHRQGLAIFRALLPADVAAPDLHVAGVTLPPGAPPARRGRPPGESSPSSAGTGLDNFGDQPCPDDRS